MSDSVHLSTSSIIRGLSPELIRHRKHMKRGYQLCVMVCGRSGSGKSTFVQTLCSSGEFHGGCSEIKEVPKTLEIVYKHRTINGEDGAPVYLTVVDTPGFGDFIDNQQCCANIQRFLENTFDKVLANERSVKRDPKPKEDLRVHACLYFLYRQGIKGLHPLDVMAMHQLSIYCNVIPVIGKADAFTPAELQRNKTLVMSQIAKLNIPIYNFPCDDTDHDACMERETILSKMPFALIGADRASTENHDGKPILVREFPWGSINIEDEDHNDFSDLRRILFGSHIQDLYDTTHNQLYERYRESKLSSYGTDSMGEDVESCRNSSTNHTSALPNCEVATRQPAFNYSVRLSQVKELKAGMANMSLLEDNFAYR